MSKNKIVEADLADEEAEDSDTNPIGADGELIFDDLSPRFVRSLDAAVEKQKGKPAKVKADEDEDLDTQDDEDLDESETDDAEDEPADEETEEEEVDAEDVDADEPRRGNPKFEKRLARADRLLEESRAQIAELQTRDREREAKDKLAASETEYSAFKGKTEADLTRLKKELVAATENGETEKQIDLQDKITDLKADLRAKTNEFETAKAAVTESSKRKQVSTIVATKVNQWKRRNPRYSTDAAFASVVNGLDAALIQSGSDNESDTHYKELDKKLHKLYPELAPKVRTQRRHPSQQQSRESSPGQRRVPGDARVRVKGGKLSIAPAKLERIKANMQRFNIEPTAANIKEYVQNNPGI